MSLLAARLAIETGLLVLVWIVQTIVYPSFVDVERARFREWHASYSAKIAVIVAPLMFGQVGVVALQVHADGWRRHWLTVVGVLLAWGATAVFSVPAHGRLQRLGRDSDTVRHLVRTNWLRTLAWTVTAAIAVRQAVS